MPLWVEPTVELRIDPEILEAQHPDTGNGQRIPLTNLGDPAVVDLLRLGNGVFGPHAVDLQDAGNLVDERRPALLRGELHRAARRHHMPPVDAPGRLPLDIQRSDSRQEQRPASGEQIADESGDLFGHRVFVHFRLFLWNDFGAEFAAVVFGAPLPAVFPAPCPAFGSDAAAADFGAAATTSGFLMPRQIM